MLHRACDVCGELGHEPAACRHAATSAQTDYDAAGRALLEGTDSTQSPTRCLRNASCECHLCNRSAGEAAGALLGRRVAPLNIVWQPSEGGGAVYVGSIQAATNEALLKSNGITHVVNCMRRRGLNKVPGVSYYNFDIEQWHAAMPDAACHKPWLRVPRTQESAAAVLGLFAPVFEFVQGAVDQGGACLIHCFAGAHRAGTTGVAFLMHKERLSVERAIEVAEKRRPVIDPKAYADLQELLLLLEEALGTRPRDPAVEGEADDSGGRRPARSLASQANAASERARARASEF